MFQRASSLCWLTLEFNHDDFCQLNEGGEYGH